MVGWQLLNGDGAGVVSHGGCLCLSIAKQVQSPCWGLLTRRRAGEGAGGTLGRMPRHDKSPTTSAASVAKRNFPSSQQLPVAPSKFSFKLDEPQGGESGVVGRCWAPHVS